MGHALYFPICNNRFIRPRIPDLAKATWAILQ